jgi:hypothetical protein
MNPFAQMTQALTRPPKRWHPMLGSETAAIDGLNRTDALRTLLRLGGPASAIDLAQNATGHNLKTSAVSALLKKDIQKGQITFNGELYAWNHEFDQAVYEQISDAIALLKRHGFGVTEP